jgi:hypothetical protein
VLTTAIPIVPITITLGTQVEALAKYAARASFADLSVQSRRQLPVDDGYFRCWPKPGPREFGWPG